MKTKTANRPIRLTEIYENSLAGVQYSDYQRVSLKAGDKLQLVWERGNAHDSNAISVRKDGTHIGYIKATDTHILHEYRKYGVKLHTELVSFNKNNPSWSALVIRVKAPNVFNTNNEEEM